MAIKAIINNTEKEIEQIKNSDEQDIDYVYSRIGDTEVEGEPPISIKSIGGNLADYRIYGNTVGGESVGDLVESGEHEGEYNVPVTVEGKNLLQNTATSQTKNGVTFTVNSDRSVTCNGTATRIAMYTLNDTFSLEPGKYKLTGCPAGGGHTYNYKLDIVAPPTTYATDFGYGSSFTLSSTLTNALYRIIIYNNQTCDNLTFYPMVRKADIEDNTYEPYHPPVTTNLYLPEQIKKVGDEAEYIDYSEQKLHRVRKNLLQNQAVDRKIEGVTFTVNSDGSITCNGTASDNTNSGSISSLSLPAGSYYLNGTPSGGSLSTYYMYVACYTESEIILYNDVGDGVSFTIDNSCNINVRIAIKSGCTCNNLTFYPMIRKADITDDTYEPYIVNTEVNTNLPALSTIKGTNILSVNTSIQLSNIYIKDSFDYKKVFTATRTIEDELPLNYRNIEDNDSTLDNYRIYGNTVGGESVGDLVTSGQHAGEYEVPVITSRKAKHTATLQLHDCLPSIMQFDAQEALYYAENGLTAGTYNFTIQDYDTAYGGGKTYQFTLANDVPAKGQLVFGWSYNTQASAAKITSYASSTSTTAIEQVGVTEGSGGTSLGTTDGNSTNVNHIHRVRYGSNNYGESTVRQFLNSNAVAGNVWTPQTKFDRPPVWNANIAGFMNDIDCDFLAALGVSHKITALNTVIDDGGYVVLDDKFFLLSRSEVYGGKENNIDEGEPYPYYSNYSDLSAAYTGNDSNRIKYKSGTAQWWWLRSPHFANGNYVRSINPTGSVSGNSNANIAIGVAPACNIELDENYKYNGQILHIRDQISVQKGNDTLIFDVIGIDHDDVNFDVTTTPIYLPEQIRKVGDEAEYIDYGEQKLHRVRKNLLQNTTTSRTHNGVTFTVNDDKSITCNGTSTSQYYSYIELPILLLPGQYRLSGCPLNGDTNTYRAELRVNGLTVYGSIDIGNGSIFTVSSETEGLYFIRIQGGYTVENKTFYPMIRKADIEDDTYEPYIENTDLDVTLPALPTLPGTNVLSVGTEVQPREVYIKGKIKEIN